VEPKLRVMELSFFLERASGPKPDGAALSIVKEVVAVAMPPRLSLIVIANNKFTIPAGRLFCESQTALIALTPEDVKIQPVEVPI